MDALLKSLMDALIGHAVAVLKALWQPMWRFVLCPIRKLAFPIVDARTGIKQSRMRYYQVEFSSSPGSTSAALQEIDSNGNLVGYFDSKGVRFIPVQPHEARVVAGGYFQFPSWGKIHWRDIFNGDAASGCWGISER